MENLAALIRDPSGRGLRTDPQALSAARAAMSKLFVNYGRM
jgi:hypothetical protein